MTTLHAVAGYLPGFKAEDLQWQTLRFQGRGATLDVAVPELSPAQWVVLAERVKQGSRAYLKTLTVSQIIAVVDRAVARLLDPKDPYRYLSVRGTVVEITEEGAIAHIDILAKKYRGVDVYQGPRVDRVIYKIKPEKINTRG